MKKLLSLPPHLVTAFHQVTGHDKEQWFCSNDPVGRKLGSGGGTAWLLRQCYEHENSGEHFAQWLSKEKRIILHAGGQSRRLPAYAWEIKVLPGQCIDIVPIGDGHGTGVDAHHDSER